MFDTPQERAFLRAAVAAILAGITAAASIWVDVDALQVAAAVAASFGAYLAVGAAVPQVEPNFGNKMDPEDQ